MSLLTVCFLGCFLQAFAQGEVFRRNPDAHTVFLRPKRANQFFVEELWQGDLERECYEERCNFEEAREAFEDDEKTIAFWTIYYDGDQCLSSPCLNGGNCTDKVGGFTCSCSAPYYGTNCELSTDADEVEEQPIVKSKLPEMLECPTEGPRRCHQLCKANFYSFTCSCMSGFKLQDDGRSCLPEVKFPCGRTSANSTMCLRGKCPWQVSVFNTEGAELCAGVLLGQRSVLTTASCLYMNSGAHLRPSHFFIFTGNRRLTPVRALYLHGRFQLHSYDYDLALLELARPVSFGPALIHLCLPTKDFSENILMSPGRTAVVEKKPPVQSLEAVYMTLEDCRKRLSVSHSLSNKMFCTGWRAEASGSSKGIRRSLGLPSSGMSNITLMLMLEGRNQMENGANLKNGSNTPPGSPLSGSRESPEVNGSLCDRLLQGSPVATVEKGTAFLTGLLISSSGDCDGLVFIKVSRYLNWIRPRLQMAEDHMTSQLVAFPEHR